MKKTIANLAVFSLLGVASLCAQSSTVKATIPFDFTVGKTVMPSGEYRVSFGSPQGVILARAADGRSGVMSTSNATSRNSNLGEGKLVFNVYGHRRFLSQVWVPGLMSGREVVKTKAERELAGQHKEIGLAAIRATLP